MRLHWFLPARSRSSRWLKRIGPTWAASPLRRVVQGLALVLFLVLFFYVSWPYTARPARSWPGWLPVEVDAATGEVTLASDSAPSDLPTTGSTVWLRDPAGGDAEGLGAFRIVAARPGELDLQPREPPAPSQIDAMLASFGPWTIAENDAAAWPSHYTDNLARKEFLPAESFLALDPLVSLSTALASRTWVWSLGAAGVLLAVSVLIPRGFCGYLCPLGTLVDLADWLVNRRLSRIRLPSAGWWVHLKYYMLAAVGVAALCGVLVAGYVAAIPVVTRGLALTASPLQTGLHRGWGQVPPMGWGELVSVAMFVLVLALGLLAPRFWCKYVCPSGAIFSLCSLARVGERKVRSGCIHCNRCVEACPFDAIKPDFTTRTADCTLCQTCGGVCPPQAIQFASRWNRSELKPANVPSTDEPALGRRGFLATAAGLGAACAGGLGVAAAARAGSDTRPIPVRPPGSVPEREFLAMCVRCGECLQACPNAVLQPMGFRRGLDALWTPEVVADWSGCDASCNVCGQVCPTGAIRALPLDEKRVARMGLAVVDTAACLPYAGREACQLCVDECTAAGYRAIEFMRVGTQADSQGQPIEGTGFLAPVVRADRCVGCGLCQTRCRAINAAQKRLLARSAVTIVAGPGCEDRLMEGSYRALREEEAVRRVERSSDADDYLPSFLQQ